MARANERASRGPARLARPAATGAELRVDGLVYSTYAVKATDDIIQFKCAPAGEQTWTLSTTGGYGPAATDTAKVTP